MQRIFLTNLLFLLSGLLSVWAETSNGFEPLEPIYARIQALIKQNTDQNIRIEKIHIQKLGKKIRLPKCNPPVDIVQVQRGKQSFSTRPTFIVRCKQPAWKLFIRTSIQASRPVIIAAHPIPRNTLIQADQITQRWMNISQIRPQVLSQPEQAIGFRAKRTIAPNTLITAQMLLPPYWVHKNSPVTLITRIGSLEVRTKGIALKNAVENEIVAVKNERSGRTVRGIVIAPNTVLVP